MFFGIEFSKIFKRKFNYLIGIIIVLIAASLIFRIGSLTSYYNISAINFIYDFVLKIILGLVVFMMGINYIYSYREDYTNKVSVLLSLNNKIAVRDVVSLIANLIYFAIYYVIIALFTLGILFLRQRDVFDELLNSMRIMNIVAYFVLVILLLLFANLIFLLALSLFNNTNLAISLSLLYFVGGETIATMLSNKISFLDGKMNNSVLNVFANTFNSLTQYVDFSTSYYLPLVLNLVGLIVVIIIVRLIKKIII